MVCECGKICKSVEDLEQHISTSCTPFRERKLMRQDKKRATCKVSRSIVCECGTVIPSEKCVVEHLNGRRHFKRLSNQNTLLTHSKADSQKKQQTKSKAVFCHCGKICKSKKGLEQHKSVKHVEEREMSASATGLKRSSKLQEYMEEFYDNDVKVDKDDRKISVAIVRETLLTMMAYVRRQLGGEFYNPGLTKAGSHAVNTKIGKADEFDWGVSLIVNPKDMMMRTAGSVPYTIFDQDNNLNVDLPAENETSTIPAGYAAVSLRPGANVPRLFSHLLHGNYLVPRFIKQDLYNKIKTALENSGLEREGVHINRESHGPALTLTIMPPKAGSHHISLDIVASLPCDTPLTSSGWPRPSTTRAFRAESIQAAKDAGTHLVPKKDTVFDISYSKAEKALLENIDSGNGCRKKCHKVIKKYVQTFSSRNSASGISSHIFKQQLLNMVEAHPDPDYWNKKNFGERVVDMLRDCEDKLRAGILPNHFVPTQNVLEGKNRGLLNRLADFFRERRLDLEQL